MATPVTYSAQKPIRGATFSCPRCERTYAFPQDGAPAIRCECGWRYTNVGNGHIVEEFKTRIGGAKNL